MAAAVEDDDFADFFGTQEEPAVTAAVGVQEPAVKLPSNGNPQGFHGGHLEDNEDLYNQIFGGESRSGAPEPEATEPAGVRQTISTNDDVVDHYKVTAATVMTPPGDHIEEVAAGDPRLGQVKPEDDFTIVLDASSGPGLADKGRPFKYVRPGTHPSFNPGVPPPAPPPGPPPSGSTANSTPQAPNAQLSQPQQGRGATTRNQMGPQIVVPPPRPPTGPPPPGTPAALMKTPRPSGAANGQFPRVPPGCRADLEPAWPSKAAPDQAIKLPGQTRVTPDEYKEFLALGHGEIFNLELDRVIEAPWGMPGVDTSDYFNYDMDEKGWLEYCKYVERHRQEFTMKKKIQTYESGPVNPQQDPDLPPEVAAAIAAESLPPGDGLQKALPIPVYQGVDDFQHRNRRGRDFRRPEVRYDPEVIIELAGGISPSQGVNADYGDEYIPLFGTKAEVGQDESPGSLENGMKDDGFPGAPQEEGLHNARSVQQAQLGKGFPENRLSGSPVKHPETMQQPRSPREGFKHDETWDDPLMFGMDHHYMQGRGAVDLQPGALAMGMEDPMHHQWHMNPQEMGGYRQGMGPQPPERREDFRAMPDRFVRFPEQRPWGYGGGYPPDGPGDWGFRPEWEMDRPQEFWPSDRGAGYPPMFDERFEEGMPRRFPVDGPEHWRDPPMARDHDWAHDHERPRDYDRDRDDRERGNERDRIEKVRERERDDDRDRRHREYDQEDVRERERYYRERIRDRERDRDRDREKERDRYRDDRERYPRDAERSRERGRDREREKDRDRDRYRDDREKYYRERNQERDYDRERGRDYNRDRDHRHEDEYDRERGRKRQRSSEREYRESRRRRDNDDGREKDERDRPRGEDEGHGREYDKVSSEKEDGSPSDSPREHPEARRSSHRDRTLKD